MDFDRIEELISQMTLKEKVGQLTQELTNNARMDELAEMAERGELGSCLLTATPWAGNSEQEDLFIDKLNNIQRAAVEKSRLGIPVINARDVIHGSKTIFPIPLAQTATWDYNLIKESAEIMSKEASLDGVHWTFAPMLDICNEPRWGRIIECPGEDVLLGQMFARASVEGIQGNDMSEKGRLAACAKHYIGYGASCAGRDKDPCEWSDYTLRNKALPAFEAAVDAGVATVMSAFNEISGQPATSSSYHLRDILKGELGFGGFVISDWAAIERLKCQGVSDNDALSCELAINAGVDMDMVDGIYKNNLEELVESGKVKMEIVDDAVRRILEMKYKLGLFDNPYFDEGDHSKEFMTEEYLAKAKEVSAHSMVLLKNNGVLPLEKGTPVTLGGSMAEEKFSLLGSWHAGGRACDVVSLKEGLINVNGEENVFTNPSVPEDGICRYIDDAKVCILAIGESSIVTGEHRSLARIELPENQIAYAKYAKEREKKVIAVIFAGRPRAIGEILPYCDAVLWAWHGGTMCGQAAAEILFGEFNPCGRLPVTLPRSTGQIPMYYNHNRNEYNLSGYYKNEDVTYRDMISTPEFVFGYGLSYTDFEYSDYKCEADNENQKIIVNLTVKNTGKYDGYEIVQCYISDIVASMSRPIKELKAFEKVFLTVGEEKRITLEISMEALSFYNNSGKKIFEEGEFKVEIGKNCCDILYEENIMTDFLIN